VDRGIKRRLHIHDIQLMAQGEAAHARPFIERRFTEPGILLKDSELLEQGKRFTG